MITAIWNNTVLAESDLCEEVEGNSYFPIDSIKMEYLKPSNTKTMCPWKGEANYFNIEVNGSINKDAAWSYQETKPEANNIKGYVAFWKGVKINK